MKAKLSEMAEESHCLNYRVGKFFVEIVREIREANKTKDYEAQRVLEAIAKEAVESVSTNDYALFEEAEREYAVRFGSK